MFAVFALFVFYMHLDDLNALDADAAARELLRCCGSTRWADRLAAARPFRDFPTLADSADRIWWQLERADWLEAFAAHPRIGAGGAGGAGGAERAGGAGPERWSAQEQSGVAGVSRDVAERLATANSEYASRFGYIFIICATGKSAAEMLDALEGRLAHSPEQELGFAAEEQRKITRLRLSKLLDTGGAPLQVGTSQRGPNRS
ncbi:MAG TPA: 2-oxo-4-hydroxy-4-carboxy-5-ureidoimidazoline decarboxylase [Vicinamibacterales bacterium]|nr:2-oxo-4-hydroxy-4-carboxy-5-ureidoimidazoline decarboxylase [Vicinamibacterales bacterium]